MIEITVSCSLHFCQDHNTCRHSWCALVSLSPWSSTFLSIMLISSLPSPFLFIFIPTLSLWHSLSTVSNYISQCSTFLVANPCSTLLINKTKTKRTFLFCTPGFCIKTTFPFPPLAKPAQMLTYQLHESQANRLSSLKCFQMGTTRITTYPIW